MTDRRTLQAEGKHPAPCARHCEAKAFEIEIRGLKSALRARLEQPKREPLTDEDIEQAQRAVWRSLPSDFDYTTSSWIEIGIRYAEAAHGIGEKP